MFESLSLGVGSQVLLAGLDNISGLSGDEGAVGVGHQGGGVGESPSGDAVPGTVPCTGGVWVGTSVSGPGGGSSNGGNWGNWEALGGEVVGAGSHDSGLVSRDDGTVGVSNQGHGPLGADNSGGGEESQE